MQARDVRRHHLERLKVKRKHYWGYRGPKHSSYGELPEPGKHEMSPRRLGQVSQHPQSCSCLGCGNERRFWGNSKEAKTAKEQSFIETQRKFENED
ncbi:hypothetical protein D3C87_278880 [compost metagenome]